MARAQCAPEAPGRDALLDDLRAAYAEWRRWSEALEEADADAEPVAAAYLAAARERIRAARRRLGLPVPETAALLRCPTAG